MTGLTSVVIDSLFELCYVADCVVVSVGTSGVYSVAAYVSFLDLSDEACGRSGTV